MLGSAPRHAATGWREAADEEPESPDRAILWQSMQSLAAVVRPKAQALASAAAAAVDNVMQEAEVQAAVIRSEALAALDAQVASIAPWQTLGEQFSILEDELRVRIMNIALSESNFTAERQGRRRPGNILPGCGPMAKAALEADDNLRQMRFQLVPKRLSEEDFWRAYFWHVANVKCELLHDWKTANTVRRTAVMEDEAALAPDDEPLASATDGPPSTPAAIAGEAEAASTTVPLDDLDAEFERLVTSPS